MTTSDEIRQHLEAQGPEKLRYMLQSGQMPGHWQTPAIEFVAEHDRREQAKAGAAARRIEIASWIAAATGIVALVFAALALL